MVRTVTKKYQIWLAGFYDDFNGARAIPDDLNKPSDSSYSILKSHFGNPLNGEAFLNPRFRFSIEDRNQDTAIPTGMGVASSSNRYLQNDGIFEWLTHDDTRLNYTQWEGRAQLQFPDGHVPNRYKFNNDTSDYSDGYQRFINGHDSSASYLVPTGDNDSSYGREESLDFTDTNYNNKQAGVTTANDFENRFMQRAHLAGVFTGEVLDLGAGTPSSTDTPTNTFQEICSPAKKPFLIIQSARHNFSSHSPNVPTIIYDGNLNTALDGDIFTARVALHSTMATNPTSWTDVGIKFEIGFTTAQAGILSQTGYTGTPAIDFTLDLDEISYDTTAYLGEATNDALWIDVDFKFDYTNNKFKAYYNGTEITSTNATAGSYSSGYTMSGGSATTASNLYGYQITVTDLTGSSGDNGYVTYLMLDRVGMVRYLTDDFTNVDPLNINHPDVQIQRLGIRQATNGISTCDVKIADDPGTTGSDRGASASDYVLNLRNLFVSTEPLNWSLLVFADYTKRIDRPIWRGLVADFSIVQKNDRSREITISAKDSIEELNNQIPLWEMGQLEQTETGESTNYWSYDAQGYRDIMNLGAGKLKMLGKDVGFDTDSSHLESSTQRTQLGSGHPIQMYNNEDVYGPNNIEDSYEGFGVKGFVEPTGSATNIVVIPYDANHGVTTSDSITVISGKHNSSGNISPSAVDGTTGEMTFAASDLAYVPESSKIFYIGKYPGLDSARAGYWDNLANMTGNPIELQAWRNIYNAGPVAAHPTGTGPLYMHAYFETDPGLTTGEKFYINRRNDADNADLSSGYRGQHTVLSVVKYRSYLSVNAGTMINTPGYFWVVKTSTEYSGTESHGDYASDTFLTSTARFSWSNDTGIIKDTFKTGALALKQRAIHGRWMRDLPQSLWFKYHFGKITGQNTVFLAGTDGIKTGQGTITSSTKMIEVTNASTGNASGGIMEIWKWPGTGPINNTNYEYVGKFLYQGKITYTVGGTDKYYLIGCKYLDVDIVSGSIINYFRLRDQSISDDYKHIWLLWSDMRNNGEADADGSERKVSFGLQYPISDNYEFDLYFSDQVDTEGKPQKFGDLKVGEDLNVWTLDATTDPCTNTPWSKPVDYANGISLTPSTPLSNDGSDKLKISTSSSSGTDGFSAGDYVYLIGSASHDGYHTVASTGTGFLVTNTNFVSATMQLTGGTTSAGYIYPATGSEKDLDVYHDWEDKAGSFLVIDTSKFFNLNTHANAGKTGQSSGGNTDLTEYISEREGFPALIDNYWREAIGSYATTGDLVFQHPNQSTLISDVVLAPLGFVQGSIGLPLDDVSEFAESGAGKLVTVYNSDRTGNDERYFAWDGKLSTEYTSSSAIDNPISATTYQGVSVYEITNAGEDHAGGGIKKGMVMEKITSGGTSTYHNILAVGDTSGNNTDTKLVVERTTTAGASVTWLNTDTYKVPVQLGMILEVPMDDATNAVSHVVTALEQEIWDRASASSNIWADYGITSSFTGGGGSEPIGYEVHSTVGSDYLLRLMMHIDGFYKSTGGGTYWTSDKLRMLWNAAIMDTWLPSITVNSIFGINNVPITSHMTTYNDTSSNDYYGSIVDIRGKTLGQSLRAIQEKASMGVTNYTTFSYLMGRDNRIELRPKYNSGIALNRDNMRISTIRANMNKQIKNVRVYYGNGKAFVDFPAVALTDSTKWRVLEMPNIVSSEEALIVAKKEYNSRKNNSLNIVAEPILDAGKEHKMIETGRYGYVADPYIALDASGDSVFTLVTSWTRLGTGGVLFPGMVNALDGNMNVDIDPLKTRYGTSKRTTSSGNVDWNKNYYWYGSNSISHALQIVHIPNNTPLVSSATSEPMRIWIDLKSGQSGTDIDNAEFTVNVADYSFSGTARTASISGSVVTKDVKHSGFYEIAFPTNYGAVANAKIVFSFNAEYCRALLRHRCGDPTHANILKQVATNTDTIFPLGMREYSEMNGGFRESGTGKRLVWYAPRINICNDLSYVPATYVTMTDAGIEMNAETLVIKDVSFSVTSGKTEDVSLSLERDEGLERQNLMTYLFGQNTDGLVTGSGVGVGNGDSGSIYGDDTKPGIPPENKEGELTDPTGQELGMVAYTQRLPDSSYRYGRGITSNDLNSNTFRRMKGSMNIFNDNLSGNNTVSILGQNKVSSVVPHTMRGIEGMNADISPIGGSATLTSDGYVFGAKGLMGGESAASSKEMSIETQFKVPLDVLTDRLNVQAIVTHNPEIGSSTTAILYTTVTVENTGYSITHTTRVGTGNQKKPISLLPTMSVSGANVAGNTIKVTVSRKPGVGDDDANTSSVTIHDLDVVLQRASAHSKSSISQFKSDR